MENMNIDSESINLVIKGDPIAQKRHRSTMGKGFVRQYDPSASDKKDFLSILQNQAPDKPFDCPLMLITKFYFARPKSHFGTGKNASVLKASAPLYHTCKPDNDNLLKFAMDALNKVYWRDDSLIAGNSILKVYSDNPRTEISIHKLF